MDIVGTSSTNSLLVIGPFWVWSQVLQVHLKSVYGPLFLLNLVPRSQYTQKTSYRYPYYEFIPSPNKKKLCYTPFLNIVELLGIPTPRHDA